MDPNQGYPSGYSGYQQPPYPGQPPSGPNQQASYGQYGQYGGPPQGYPQQQQAPGSGFQQQPPMPGQYAPPPPQQEQQQQQQQYAPFGSGEDRGQAKVEPAPPSLGYVSGQMASGDASNEAQALRKAMKGMGTDEDALINVLSRADPLKLALIRHTYLHQHGRDLETDLKSETSAGFELALVSLATGPLGMDVRHLKIAVAGMGTDEGALEDILLCRTNADIKAIKAAYVETFKEPLETALRNDLSGNSQRLFLMLLEARRPEPGTPYDPQVVESHTRRLRKAIKEHEDKDIYVALNIFQESTDEKLIAIRDKYFWIYEKQLASKMEKKLSGDVRSALLAWLHRAEDPAYEIANRLYSAKPVSINRYIYWIIKMHWDPTLFEAVKKAFFDLSKLDMADWLLQHIEQMAYSPKRDRHLFVLLRKLLKKA